jgi:phosphate-selective porin OprO/OprP
MRTSGWSALAAVTAIGLLPLSARAQSGPSNAELQREVIELTQKVEQLEAADRQHQELDQRVRIIDRKLEVEQETALDKAKTTPTVTFSPARGFHLTTPDGNNDLHIGGLMQIDQRYYLTQTKPTGSEFLIRRLRPILEGTIARYYDFRLMPDFGNGTTLLYDAYADIHYWPELRLRAGKFKEPVGLEELQEDRNLKFVERALPSALLPNRATGADLHGLFWDQRVEYEVGAFNQVPSNTAAVDTSVNDGKDFAARLYFHPFANSDRLPLQNIGLGVAGTYGDTRTATTLDTYKSAGQFTLFKYGGTIVGSGPRYRITPQADWYWGPFGFLGEWVQNTQRVGKPVTFHGGTSIAHPRTISDQAWQVQLSYVLTGEDNGYNGIKPHRDFNPFGSGLGAWEVAARLDQLLIDRDTYNTGLATKSAVANEAFEYAVGLNWYLNENVKLMLDYEHTGFHYGASKGTTVRDLIDESAVLSRLQIAF